MLAEIATSGHGRGAQALAWRQVDARRLMDNVLDERDSDVV